MLTRCSPPSPFSCTTRLHNDTRTELARGCRLRCPTTCPRSRARPPLRSARRASPGRFAAAKGARRSSRNIGAPMVFSGGREYFTSRSDARHVDGGTKRHAIASRPRSRTTRARARVRSLSPRGRLRFVSPRPTRHESNSPSPRLHAFSVFVGLFASGRDFFSRRDVFRLEASAESDRARPNSCYSRPRSLPRTRDRSDARRRARLLASDPPRRPRPWRR